MFKRGRDIVFDFECDDRPELDQPTERRARLTPLEQPLGALGPSQRDRHAVTARVVKTQLDRQASCASHITLGDTYAEGTLTEVDTRLELAEPHRRRGCAFEIINAKRRVSARPPERLERCRPIRLAERSSSVR